MEMAAFFAFPGKNFSLLHTPVQRVVQRAAGAGRGNRTTPHRGAPERARKGENTMHMKEQGIRAAAAAALGALCAYGVQMFVPLVVLVAAMMLDYATGLAKAYSAGELSSRVGIRGILKKLGYLVIVAVAGMLDWLIRYGAAALGWEWTPEFLVSSVVIVWLIINELLSILENVEAIGVPVPAFLRKLIGRLKVSTEAKADTEEA